MASRGVAGHREVGEDMKPVASLRVRNSSGEIVEVRFCNKEKSKSGCEKVRPNGGVEALTTVRCADQRGERDSATRGKRPVEGQSSKLKTGAEKGKELLALVSPSAGDAPGLAGIVAGAGRLNPFSMGSGLSVAEPSGSRSQKGSYRAVMEGDRGRLPGGRKGDGRCGSVEYKGEDETELGSWQLVCGRGSSRSRHDRRSEELAAHPRLWQEHQKTTTRQGFLRRRARCVVAIRGALRRPRPDISIRSICSAAATAPHDRPEHRAAAVPGRPAESPAPAAGESPGGPEAPAAAQEGVVRVRIEENSRVGGEKGSSRGVGGEKMIWVP